jgi:aspartate/methionine/tyrosine aminotransferase
MSSLSLAKSSNLPEGWIDACVGEVSSVAKHLLHLFRFSLDLTSPSDFAYPPPNGNKELVKLLEDKYQAPVIITNGAKQGLAAIFYALSNRGCKTLGMNSPYWSLIPPLAKIYGLTRVENGDDHDAYLAVDPNNPDGRSSKYEWIKSIADSYQNEGDPFIHDAAYYSHTYLPADYRLGPIGDVQIFSASKMLGLSGLRTGWCVFYNTSLHNDVLEYVEATTVGVSNLSQRIIGQILSPDQKELYQQFEQASYQTLLQAKEIAKQLKPEVLEVPANLEKVPGVFGWFKKGSKFNPDQAQVLLADGKPFGDASMIRMNLGLPLDTLKMVIERLNNG